MFKEFIQNRIIHFFKNIQHDIQIYIYNHFKDYNFDCIFTDSLCQECYERWCLEYSKEPKCYFCSHLKFKWFKHKITSKQRKVNNEKM